MLGGTGHNAGAAKAPTKEADSAHSQIIFTVFPAGIRGRVAAARAAASDLPPAHPVAVSSKRRVATPASVGAVGRAPQEE